MIPSINILDLLDRFRELSENLSTSDAIIKLFNEKNNEINRFVDFMSIIISIIITLVLFLLSFFYYTQKEFHKNIEDLKTTASKKITDLKTTTSKKIGEVETRIHGIDITLKEHFDDYSELMKYNHLNEHKIIHHKFEEALKYDTEKIYKLTQKNTYKSTVILNDEYLKEISEISLLENYMKMKKCILMV